MRENCQQAGYPMLSKIDKGALNKILSKGNIKPHKISYYLEKRDPEFEIKMANVLNVYKPKFVDRVNSIDPAKRDLTAPKGS